MESGEILFCWKEEASLSIKYFIKNTKNNLILAITVVVKT
jgi:hypothetical protein